MNRAFMSCTSEREVMRELAANLPRLRVSRCFVVLLQPSRPGEPQRGRLGLAHPRRSLDELDLATFPVVDVLPPELADELSRGTLLAQSLTVPSHELGYVLYEQAPLHDHTTEVLRLDLSRALNGISRHLELEGVVTRRTEQLRSEIAVRQRTEAALHVANAELRRSLHRDGLTGIANRIAFDTHLAGVWEEHQATGAELSVLFVDVDCFKAYNDAYGHLHGDEALRAVARAIEAPCRDEDDLAARFGGEEFTVVLPGTSAAGAAVVAERVRQNVRRARIEHRASSVMPWLTVSIGIATVVPEAHLSPDDLVEAADRAVYAAKAAGRDRTATAVPVAPTLPA
jgi:diguanylate cyclase (GGDEF)-like protein